jgi:zinc transport system permease protein
LTALLDFVRAVTEHAFLQRAILAGSFVAVSCSFLGVFLVLRRLSLIGDGLAHVAFGGVGLGLALGWAPLYVSMPVVLAASLGILQLSEKARVRGDAAIGLVAAVGIAVGVTFASKAPGSGVELDGFLFGSILAIEKVEVWLSVILSLMVVGVTSFFYNDLFAVTFDADYARVLGVRSRWINRVLVLCTAATVVLGIRLVGALLISALIIFPAVSALQIMRGFFASILAATAIGVFSVWAGVCLSYLWDLPSGAAIVDVNLAVFLVAYAIGSLRS